jgi:hypothetical protein
MSKRLRKKKKMERKRLLTGMKFLELIRSLSIVDKSLTLIIRKLEVNQLLTYVLIIIAHRIKGIEFSV